jgi:hypothetical protein
VVRCGPELTFTFKLEQIDGAPADPPTIVLGVYRCKPATRSRRPQPAASSTFATRGNDVNRV